MNKRFTSPIDRASEIILLAHQNFLHCVSFFTKRNSR